MKSKTFTVQTETNLSAAPPASAALPQRAGLTPAGAAVVSKTTTMKTTDTINNWEPETKSLLNALTAAGFKLVSGDNGEEQFKFAGSLPDFIENLTACDESRLYVEATDGKRRWLYLVYGNCPGELVSDYVCDDGLDEVTDAHYEKWSGRKQPMKTGYYDGGKWVNASVEGAVA